jgi:hypothetical protein
VKGFGILRYNGSSLDISQAILDHNASDPQQIPEYPVTALDPGTSIPKVPLKPVKNATTNWWWSPLPKKSDRQIVLAGRQVKVSYDNHHKQSPSSNNTEVHLKWELNGHVYETPKEPLLLATYRATFNDTYEETIQNPLVFEIEDGEVIDIVFQNTVTQNGVCEQHPWHLHGHHFW